MTADPAQVHAPPAAQPLDHARRCVLTARMALQAAANLQPELLEQVAPLHAVLADVEQQLERVKP